MLRLTRILATIFYLYLHFPNNTLKTQSSIIFPPKLQILTLHMHSPNKFKPGAILTILLVPFLMELIL